MKLAALALTALTAFGAAAPAQASLTGQWNQQNTNTINQTNADQARCDALFNNVNFQTGYDNGGYAVRNGKVTNWRPVNGQRHDCWNNTPVALDTVFTTMSRNYPGQIFAKHQYTVENGVLFIYNQSFNRDGSANNVRKSSLAFSCNVSSDPGPQFRGQMRDWQEVQADRLQSDHSKGGRNGYGMGLCASTGQKFFMGDNSYDSTTHRDGTGFMHSVQNVTPGDFSRR